MGRPRRCRPPSRHGDAVASRIRQRVSSGREFLLAGFSSGRIVNKQVAAGRRCKPSETLSALRSAISCTASPPQPTITRIIEIIIYGEDIRRPLHIRHDYSTIHIAEALEYLIRDDSSGAKARLAGLRLPRVRPGVSSSGVGARASWPTTRARPGTTTTGSATLPQYRHRWVTRGCSKTMGRSGRPPTVIPANASAPASRPKASAAARATTALPSAPTANRTARRTPLLWPSSRRGRCPSAIPQLGWTPAPSSDRQGPRGPPPAPMCADNSAAVPSSVHRL